MYGEVVNDQESDQKDKSKSKPDDDLELTSKVDEDP